MARDKGFDGSVSTRNGWRSPRRWLALLSLAAFGGCSSDVPVPAEGGVVGVESAAVTAPSCSDVPAEYVGAHDGCDCPANGVTTCDSDCAQFGNPGGDWCGCEYCYEPGGQSGGSEQCSLVPEEYVGVGDGCDCPSDGSVSCDPDCTEQGNPGGAYCGCQYCYPEEEPPPTGGTCDFVPHEYIGVHDGCDCPEDGNTSCDPDCAEGNIADDYCGCQFCYSGEEEEEPPPSGPDPYAIEIPNRMDPQMVTVLARNSLNVGADAQVRRGTRGFGRVVNTGSQTTTFGARSKVGETWSSCPVSIGNNAEVGGTVYTPGSVTQGTGVILPPNGVETVPTLPDPATHTWTPHLPPRTGGDKNVTGGTTLTPGGYGNVTVSGSGVLRLGPGIYHIGDLTVGPTGKVIIDDAGGPVFIYVSGGVQFDGTIVNTNNQAEPGLQVIIVVTGSGVVRLGGFWTGTVYAPRSPVSLTKPGQPGYHGSYFGNDVTLSPGVSVYHVGFPWGSVQPDSNAPKTWGDSSIRLGAWFDHRNNQSHPQETTLDDPVNFTIPPVLDVRNGNAGTGTARLKFRDGSAPIVTCTYKGAAGVSHPTTAAQRTRGLIYEFQNCSNGSVAGQRVRVTWVSLEVVSGDAADPTKQTEIALDSQDGCSGYIPPPLHPWEVVDLKSTFSWKTTKALAETDPDGRPALWHALIYIDSKEQLAALDRLRIMWSPRPLSATYTESMRGLCGRVEHATDGTGVVVYTVIPAKIFNLIRKVSIRAQNENIAPPFAFIIPSKPEAEYANSDGSLRYDALGSSGFHHWLAERSALSPGWFSKITKPFRDAAKWVGDNIISPVSNAGETIVHWGVDSLDELVDALVPFIDDVWETTQEALGLLVYAIEDDVGVHLDVRLQNLDPNFPANSWMVRAWGPPCTTAQINQGICAGEQATTGTRPILLPTGTKFRIRQWGFGFLPVMKEKTLGSNGQIDLRALKNRTGRGGDLCIQLEADYGMITTDFIPNEVCDFATNRYGNFDSEVNDLLVIAQEDLHSFAQVKDGYDYNRTVLGRESHFADILTGWPANGMTTLVNGDPRAMTLCLDFPGGPAAFLQIVGVVTLGIGDKLYSKDIWWPDAESSRYSRRSRVMTHEYGHFTMCDLLYDAAGAGGITGLLARLSDQGEDSRDEETGIMTEMIADTYALQVAGGTDYVPSDNSTTTAINYCNGPLCYDWNYRGANDSRPRGAGANNAYYDEIARWVSLTYDAFDRVGNGSRTATGLVSNGDFWRRASTGAPLTYTTTGYLGRDDEPVTLRGSDWKKWVENWVKRDRHPYLGSVIGGLFETVTTNHTWCGACELMAAHDPAATANITMTNGSTRTPQVVLERIDFCRARPQTFAWIGDPPRADGRFNVLTCDECAASQFVDNTPGGTYFGQCRPCGAGMIATRHGCTACPAGTVPTANNDCRRCPANQISSGNSCVACPFGTAADAATNTCVFCEPDSVVDWATTALCGQTVSRTVSRNGASGDHCPNDAWLEVRNIASGPIAGNYTTFRAENFFSPDINHATQCPQSSSQIRVGYRSGSNFTTLLQPAAASGVYQGPCEGLFCPPVHCALPAVSALTKAQVTTAGNTLKVLVSAQRSGTPIGVGVKLTLTPTNPPNCGPR